MKFKQLNSIRIGSWVIPIIRNGSHPQMRRKSDEPFLGLCCSNERKIILNMEEINKMQKLNTKTNVEMEVLVHELIHMSNHFMGIDSCNSSHEVFVSTLSNLLYNILDQLVEDDKT